MAKHPTYTKQVFEYLCATRNVGDRFNTRMIADAIPDLNINQVSAALHSLEVNFGVLKAVGLGFRRTVIREFIDARPIKWRHTFREGDLTVNRAPGFHQKKRAFLTAAPKSKSLADKLLALAVLLEERKKAATGTGTPHGPRSKPSAKPISLIDKLLDLAAQAEELQRDVLARVPLEALTEECKRRTS